MFYDQIGFFRRPCQWMPEDHVSITTGAVRVESEVQAEDCNLLCQITEKSFLKGYSPTKHKPFPLNQKSI